MSQNSVHHQFMTDAISFVKSLKVTSLTDGKDVTNRLKCLKGFQISIQGILRLWKELHSTFSLKFLFISRLNQDPLENFFESVRQQGGNSDSPTPLQFYRSFKKLFYDNFLTSSLGNCTADLDRVLVGAAFNNESSTLDESISSPPESIQIDVTNYRSVSLQSNLLGMNAVEYVNGYLLKKCFLKHDCQTCRSKLVSQDLDDCSKLFFYFKAYQSHTETFGGLLAPEGIFAGYIASLESKFVEVLPSIVHKVGVGKLLMSQLPSFSVAECPAFPGEYLFKLFIRMRLYYALKFDNRELVSANKKNRKYLKF